MTVYAEGEDPSFVEEAEAGRVDVERIDGDPWLEKWLSDNRHNIPPRFGGTADEKDMCMWDVKASLWARKAAAMQLAYAAAGEGDTVVWVDADVLFHAALPPRLITETTDRFDIAYACSAQRKRRTGVETGWVMLRKGEGASGFMREMKREYDAMSSDWGRLARHDDGYVFLAVMKRMIDGRPSDFYRRKQTLVSGARCVDIATEDSNTPLTVSFLRGYVTHQKGLHAAKGADGIGVSCQKSRTLKYDSSRGMVMRALRDG